MDTSTSPNSTRRDGVDAFPVTLADGNQWGLALPSPRLRPEVIETVDRLGRPSTSIRLISESGYPREIRRFIDELRSACDLGEPDQQFLAFFQLATALIRRAHDIDLKQAANLLEIGVNELPAFVDLVLSVVSGDCSIKPEVSRKEASNG